MIETEELIEETTEGQPGETPEAPASPAAPNPADELKAAQEELRSLRAQNAEIRESERVWAERARKTNSSAPSRQPEPEISGPDLLDLIEKKGVAGLKELGFVSAAEVEAKVNEAVGTVRTESTLMSEYPELKDPSSDFYKQVNATLKSAEFADVEGPGAIRLAAKQVRAQMKATPARKNDIEQRLAVQSGVRDSAPASPAKGVTATAEQLDFATRLNVTPKQLAEQLRSA